MLFLSGGHFFVLCPGVFVAGMLQNGLSRELFEMWCSDSRNGVIIPGYCVEGTLARKIMSEPSTVVTMSGAKVPLRMSVHYISFSAHADFTETSEFVDALKPPHVILVHGDATEMGRLKAELSRRYEGENVLISTPRNCQTVELEFRKQKIGQSIFISVYCTSLALAIIELLCLWSSFK